MYYVLVNAPAGTSILWKLLGKGKFEKVIVAVGFASCYMSFEKFPEPNNFRMKGVRDEKKDKPPHGVMLYQI